MSDGRPGPQVAVVGSYNADEVVEVPEFPVGGETVTASGYREGNGGKGSNQAVAATRLGADATFVGCVGADSRGSAAFDLWEREGVDAGAVSIIDAPTGLAIVLVDESGENEIVVVPGANHELGPGRIQDAAAAIGDCDVLLVGLEVPDAAVAAAVDVATECGLPVVLDPAPARELSPEILDGVDYLTPNETEARLLAGYRSDSDTDATSLCARLRETGAGTVVVTRGARGAALDSGDGPVHVSAPTVEATDTTGAGDAFAAAFAIAIAEGHPPVDATREGCLAGAASVRTEGVVPALPTRADLEGLRE